MKYAIEIKDLTKKFGDKLVFDGFSYSFPEKGITAVSGPSGRGKTTLLRIIAGLDAEYTGKVTVSPDAKLSYVFQEDRLLPRLSAFENVKLFCGDGENADKYLSLLGLSEARNKKPSELSGGMKRRVAAARAFAYGGSVMLLDEPFSGLDSDNKNVLLGLIKRFAENGLVILVTHDPADAKTLGAETLEI